MRDRKQKHILIHDDVIDAKKETSKSDSNDAI